MTRLFVHNVTKTVIRGHGTNIDSAHPHIVSSLPNMAKILLKVRKLPHIIPYKSMSCTLLHTWPVTKNMQQIFYCLALNDAGSRGTHRQHMSERFFRYNKPGYPQPVCSKLKKWYQSGGR